MTTWIGSVSTLTLGASLLGAGVTTSTGASTVSLDDPPIMAAGLFGATEGAISLDDPPIVTAAKEADWSAVTALLERGAEPGEAGADGTTALHWASYWDDIEAAARLLSAGVDPSAQTDLGVAPLWPAAENGSSEMTRMLLEAGADPNAQLLSGETLVMTAARTGNAEVVRRLLEAGADPNGSATRGQTALMWAAGQGHSEAVATLLEHGADVHARTDVRTQRMKTDKAQESHADYQVWVEQGGNTALMFAARAGDLRSAELLVEASADVDHVAAFGISPTIMAVHGGNAQLVELLLGAGADPNAAAAGYTALHAAILRGNEAAIRSLLAHGADPHARVESATPTRRQSDDFHFHEAWVGATSFWLAARFTQPEAMRLLLEHGADPLFVHEVRYPAGNREGPYIEEEGGITALMAAVGMGGRRIRRGFYQPSRADHEAQTLAAVRIAVEAGIDPRLQDASGRTAIDAAAGLRYESVVDFLAEAAAAR